MFSIWFVETWNKITYFHHWTKLSSYSGSILILVGFKGLCFQIMINTLQTNLQYKFPTTVIDRTEQPTSLRQKVNVPDQQTD